jgi:hypothetical protein
MSEVIGTHSWVECCGWTVCRRCGVVRRVPETPCRGVLPKIELRPGLPPYVYHDAAEAQVVPRIELDLRDEPPKGKP